MEDREIEKEFRQIQKHLSYLLAVSPVVIYTTGLEFLILQRLSVIM